MGTKTRKQIKRERFLKIYFHYWKLQNNPEYIEYWKRQKAFLEDFQKDPKQAFAKYDDNFFIDSENLKTRFGLTVLLVDPFKKIDWEALVDSNKVDLDIIKAFGFSPLFMPVSVQRFHREIEPNNKSEMGNPILRVLIDLNQDKKETLSMISDYIDRWRELRKLNRPDQRDQISKFYFFARVWDLRKGKDRLTFAEISEKMNTNIQTTKRRFYRAFELIYNKKYDPLIFRKARSTVYKESLKRECKSCPERKTCNDLCPDVIQYVEQDKVKQHYREVQVNRKDRKTLSHLGLEGFYEDT